MPSGRIWLVAAAGLLYSISLHEFSSRNILTEAAGSQAYITLFCTVGGFLCMFTATWKAKRRYSTPFTAGCFAVFGLFALSSFWRSYSPSLSLAKGVLFLMVFATGYLAFETGLGQRYFRYIFWSYTALLLIGLMVGFLFPSQYPLISVEEFTGRTRVSVFETYPGIMADSVALLLLLCPLTGKRVGRLPQIFLFSMNLLAGEKLSSGLLCAMLLIRFASGRRQWRSWPTVAAIVGTTCFVTVCVAWYLNPTIPNHLLSHSIESIYGNKVASDATSFDGRLPLWIESLKLLQNASLLGYGWEGVRDLMLRVASWSGSSHNGYLELALSSGILGMAFFLTGVASLIYACFLTRFPFRMHAALVIAWIVTSAVLGSAFSFPNYFGTLIFLWLAYEAKEKRTGLPNALSTGDLKRSTSRVGTV
jgi:O-antigen ligase